MIRLAEPRVRFLRGQDGNTLVAPGLRGAPPAAASVQRREQFHQPPGNRAKAVDEAPSAPLSRGIDAAPRFAVAARSVRRADCPRTGAAAARVRAS